MQLATLQAAQSGNVDVARLSSLLQTPEVVRLKSEVAKQRQENEELHTKVAQLKPYESELAQLKVEFAQHKQKHSELKSTLDALMPYKAEAAQLRDEAAQQLEEN